MLKQNLNDQWSLREAPLNWHKDKAGFVSAAQDGWYNDLTLPCDVHMPLIAAGVIKDPVLADYSTESRWIEERSWWFRRIFTADSDYQTCDLAELTLESLDVNADIFINGAWVGYHASAHYPFSRDVKRWLKPGENELLIRLTSGLEIVDDSDLAEIDFAVSTEAHNGWLDRGDKRRAFVRKPTYVYGWDWCPRIGTCGIAKYASITYHKTAAVRDVHLSTLSVKRNDQNDTATIRLEPCIELFDIIGSADADLQIDLLLEGKIVSQVIDRDLLLCSGLNYFSYEVAIEDARLWWPNGMGAQPLYQAELTLSCGSRQIKWQNRAFGIRTITLDTSRTDDQNRRFAFVVNGIPVFCKGANWIPADSIYARVTDEKYRSLISEACAANFNMLRIWGGGIYEREIFFETCDQLGILIWHDFMFGCAAYPDHLESFYDLVRKELDYQTKRLRGHACLALFCGNNENHWIYGRYAREYYDKQYGLKTANIMAPELMRSNCPEIAYWNSSPYGGLEPNDAQVGDVHHWHACMMNPDMAKRIEPKEYDQVEGRFVSEYGYPGPCPAASIKTYFDGQAIDRESKIWQLHNNTFEKYTVNAGIAKHYTEEQLELDQYILYAGMTQALMLGYSLEAMRFKSYCSGGLFWMYNDCWGEVGWTIIDYYLRRKISFYAVRRAFAPRRLILREHDNLISVVGCNDSAEAISFEMACGHVTFTGEQRSEKLIDVCLPPYSRTELIQFKAPDRREDSICYARPVDLPEITAGLLHRVDTRKLKLCLPVVRINSSCDDGPDRLVTIKADTFCHGVFLDAGDDAHLSDNYFDLLPGEERTIRVEKAAGQTFDLKVVPLPDGDS